MKKKYFCLRRFLSLRKGDGQAINEYAAVLAFVAMIVAVTLHFGPGRLGPAVSGAFSSMVNQINRLDAGTSTT